MKWINITNLLILIVYACCQNNDFEQFIYTIENKLKLLAKRLEELYLTRCEDECIPSYDSCSTQLPDYICVKEFAMDLCKSCSTVQGTLLNTEVSTVKLADVIFPPTNPNQQDVKEMICSLSKIDEMFQQNYYEIPNIKWQYVGTYNGVFRSYPGSDSCEPYDPRLRPWYVAASTGPKIIILILDVSGSMEGVKLLTAKAAFIGLIETMTMSDLVGVVTFSDDGHKYMDMLVEATSDNKELLKEFINDLSPDSGTNFEDGFVKAFEILNNSYSTSSDALLACQTIIVFLSDGIPTKGERNADKLLSKINSLDKYNSTIFTYGLGEHSDMSLMHFISCNKYGIFEYIPKVENLQHSLTTYYRMLSNALNTTSVVWTDPYIDSAGLGMTASVAYPIFDRTSEPPFLLGVASIDVLIDDLVSITNSTTLIHEFSARNQQCTKFALSECELESLRDTKCLNSTTTTETCPPIRKFPILCKNYERNFYVNDTIKLLAINKTSCCSENCPITYIPSIYSVRYQINLIITILVFICYLN